MVPIINAVTELIFSPQYFCVRCKKNVICFWKNSVQYEFSFGTSRMGQITTRVQSLLLVCLCMLFERNTGIILVYHRQNGKLSAKPAYAIHNHNRSIVRQEFEDRDMVYLVSADPIDSCLTKLRRPPEHFEDRQPAKFILLIDDVPCDNGFDAKLRNVRQKGYAGVITYPPAISNGRTLPLPIKILDDIADDIEFNLDFISHDHGVKLRKYEFRRSSKARYLLRFTDSVYDHAAKQTKTSRTSEPKRDVYDVLLDFLYFLNPSPLAKSRTAFRGIAMIVILYAVLIAITIGLIASLFFFLYRRRRDATRFARYALQPPQVFDFRPPVRVLEDAAQGEVNTEPLPGQAEEQEDLRIDGQPEEEEDLRIGGQPVMAMADGVDRPLTANEVDQLDTVSSFRVTEDKCAICQDNFTLGTAIIMPNCLHAAHKACLAGWLTTSSRRCPVCRQTIEPD